jgi:cytochrome bd-type quinol oxidase subunit 1
MDVIQGAPKYVMIVFFALGVLFVGFSLWALYLTDIPQEQFLEDPRFEEEYVKYYQWLALFGSGLIVIGWILAILGRKLGRNQGSKLV